MNKRILIKTLLTLFYISYVITKNQLIGNTTYPILSTITKIFGLALVLSGLFQLSIFLKDKLSRKLIKSLSFLFSIFLIQFLFFSQYSFSSLFLSCRIPLIFLSAFFLNFFITYNDILQLRKIFFYSTLFIIILSTFNGAPIFDFYEYADRNRMVLGFKKPSYLAEILFVNLLLLYIEFKGSVNKNKLLYINFAILISGLILTNSRAAILVLLLFFILNFLNKKSIFKPVFKKVIFAVLTSLFVYNFSSLFEELFKSGRLIIWLNNINFNLKSYLDFIFGTGYGNAVSYIDFFNTRNESDVGSFFHVDSFYVGLFIQSGILGVLLFIFNIRVLIKLLIKDTGSKLMLYSFICYAIFESTLVNISTPFAFITWLLIFWNSNNYYFKFK